MPVIVNELNRVIQTGAPAIAGFDPQHDLDRKAPICWDSLTPTWDARRWPSPYMERSTQLEPKNPRSSWDWETNIAARRIALPTRHQAYERALELDLNNVEALVSLGEMRFDQGQLDWTRVLASRALRLAPQDPRVHALVGKVEQASR